MAQAVKPLERMFGRGRALAVLMLALAGCGPVAAPSTTSDSRTCDEHPPGVVVSRLAISGAHSQPGPPDPLHPGNARRRASDLHHRNGRFPGDRAGRRERLLRGVVTRRDDHCGPARPGFIAPATGNPQRRRHGLRRPQHRASDPEHRPSSLVAGRQQHPVRCLGRHEPRCHWHLCERRSQPCRGSAYPDHACQGARQPAVVVP